MKKLMFALAAAACATVGLAEGEITSQNIVGYAQGATVAGNKIIGAQFVNVGTDKAIDLTSLKVTGYDIETEEAIEGSVSVQLLDSKGKGGMTYYWYDVPGELYGWLDAKDDPVEEGTVFLNPGDGYWTKSPNAAWTIQSAGQVQTEDYAVTLVAGNKMVVNSTPVKADLTDLVVGGYDIEIVEAIEGSVSVQVLDSKGKGGMTYYWYDVPGELYGWLDAKDDPIEEGTVFLEAGDGYWTKSPNAAWTVTMPGASVK